MTSIQYYLLTLFILVLSCSSDTEALDPETNPVTEVPPNEEQTDTAALYFPERNTSTWERIALTDLKWNTEALQPLLEFLEAKNTKSFMILHDGKIAVEAYMNGHDVSKPWYWASAGKTLTSTTVGIAQDEGLLDITSPVSTYLGPGWTNTTEAQELLISCKDLLAMTSGIDDAQGESVAKIDLNYRANAGTRWAYHNVYLKLQDVVANASNNSWETYFNTKLKAPIGMTGIWRQNNDFNVYWSDTRSMARFGLLISANGKWRNKQVVSKTFLDAATSSSQNLNPSYGYLWWLNGKDKYRLPQSQLEFEGTLIPNAPADMYAALGRNDQKIYIVPSKNIVVIRMGNAADAVNFARSSFDNALWLRLNALID